MLQRLNVTGRIISVIYRRIIVGAIDITCCIAASAWTASGIGLRLKLSWITLDVQLEERQCAIAMRQKRSIQLLPMFLLNIDRF